MRSRFRGLTAAIGLAAAGLALSGCGPMLTASAGSGDPKTEAVISMAAAPSEAGVPVNEPVTISVDSGRLTSVQVNGTSGPLPGAISDDGTTWTSQSGLDLPFGAQYQAVATAVDPEGRPAEMVESFSTVNPTSTVVPGTRYVTDYATYGVGMPITIVLKTPVADRAAVEDALQLKTSVPVAGAWSWSEDNSVVTFRPKEFWPAGTKVDLVAPLYGMKLNDQTYAAADLTLDYQIGDATIMAIDPNTFQMTVSVNGQPVRTIPVTLGKAGFETHEGIKVISAKEGTITMRSAPWSSEFYVTDNVEYSMRLTDHGEYFHAAPWSEGSFGAYANSHGCISMSTANARDLWNLTKEGDVAIMTAPTGEPARLNNGISVWNETWDQWLSKSATGEHTYGPDGIVAPAAPVAAPAA